VPFQSNRRFDRRDRNAATVVFEHFAASDDLGSVIDETTVILFSKLRRKVDRLVSKGWDVV